MEVLCWSQSWPPRQLQPVLLSGAVTSPGRHSFMHAIPEFRLLGTTRGQFLALPCWVDLEAGNASNQVSVPCPAAQSLSPHDCGFAQKKSLRHACMSVAGWWHFVGAFARGPDANAPIRRHPFLISGATTKNRVRRSCLRPDVGFSLSAT